MSTADKLTTIAENVPKVYESGQNNVKEQVEPINAELEKCLAGTSVEGQTWYDMFWDNYQRNGNLSGKNVEYLFAGKGWTKENCKPKYDIVSPSSTYMMFSANTAVTDLREFKKGNDEKVILDFSGTTDLSYCFYRSSITYIQTLDCTSATNCNNFFQASQIETIELLKLREDGKNTLGAAFANCVTLKNINVEGKIGHNGTDFKQCKNLTKSSLTSIINALSTATSGYTISLSQTAVTTAFGSVDNAEWQTLVASKPNWTISLV